MNPHRFAFSTWAPWAACSLLATLAACGGGTGPSTPPDGSALALSADNFVQAGREALSSGLQVEEMSELMDGDQTQTSLAQGLRRPLSNAAPAAALQAPAQGLIYSTRYPCDDGLGYYDEAWHDANVSHRFDSGDSVDFSFNNCTLDGDRGHGKVRIVVLSLTGNLASPEFSAHMSFTLDNLALTGSSGEVTASGPLDVTLTSSSARSGTSRVTTPAFTLIGKAGGSPSTRTLSHFAVSETRVPDGTGVRSTIRFDGTLASTALGGKAVTLATQQPLVIAAGAQHPSAGRLVVAGANGGTVRVSAVDGNNVLFELDANGDGSYESSATRTWAELL